MSKSKSISCCFRPYRRAQHRSHVEMRSSLSFILSLCFVGSCFTMVTAFDPRISPHQYSSAPQTSNSPAEPASFESKRTGFLIVDHGSRNSASNDHLREMATSLSFSLPPTKFDLVRHAHMEIASPSIPEALSALFDDEGVDRVFIHPYFLSPKGRHASTDIPSSPDHMSTRPGIK